MGGFPAGVRPGHTQALHARRETTHGRLSRSLVRLHTVEHSQDASRRDLVTRLLDAEQGAAPRAP